jgi:hypothetical protein
MDQVNPVLVRVNLDRNPPTAGFPLAVAMRPTLAGENHLENNRRARFLFFPFHTASVLANRIGNHRL